MTIPAIEPYALPTPSELPHNKLVWEPKPERAVLLVHDMQRYFVRFYPSDQSPRQAMLDNVAALRACADALGVPVVYSAQPADPVRAARGLLNDAWGPGLTAYPEQEEIVPELAPRPSDLVLEKVRYSAFHRTELLSFMRSQARDQLWICGVFAHIGVMMTAFDAFMNDVKPFLVGDAVADFSREYHDIALRIVAGRCGRVVATSGLCALEHAGAGRSAALAGSQGDAFRSLCAEISDLVASDSPLTPDASFADVGLDSVRLMELVERYARRGVSLSALDLMECEDLGALALHIERVEAERISGEYAALEI
jgi:bifunctional isochorismate lyase / aryl carrier protein